MVSLKMVLLNMLRMQHTAKCRIRIGKHSTSVPYIISSETSDRVVIGSYCSIGHGVILIVHPGHIPPKEYCNYRVATYPLARMGRQGFLPSYYLPEKRNFVFVGNDVTIGANAIILPGVTIGDGAIIGAGAIVTHDVSPYTIAAGVPAKTLRYRYNQEQIRKLLKIRWWNWSEEKITENMNYFYGGVEAFIDKFYDESGFEDQPEK
jgi:acetyltransferase-like isoleucine patch superfamily enzyme